MWSIYKPSSIEKNLIIDFDSEDIIVGCVQTKPFWVLNEIFILGNNVWPSCL